VAALAGFVTLVVLLYSASVHAVIGNSDGATVVLQGQSMGAGNLLLHHWSLSLDSFWSVDAIFYTLTVLVTGVRPLVLHLVPALIAAMVIVTGSLMARTGRRGISALASMATVLALLGLPSHVLAVVFLQGPLHVGTVLWCLVAFTGLRHGRLGWGWVMAVALFAAGALGDLQMVALGMVPAIVGGVVAMARTRDYHRGITTAAAPAVGLLVAGVVRLVAGIFGTFSIASSHPAAARLQILRNIGLIATWGGHLLGLGGGRYGYGAVPTPLELVHILGVAAVVAGVVVAAMSLIRGVIPGHRMPTGPAEGWRIDDLLVAAFVADLAVFVVLTSSGDEDFSRYLTAAVVFGSILAGRAVGRVVDGTASPWLRRSGAVLGVGVLSAFGAGVALNVAASAPSRPYNQLGQFLEAHHLDNGIGDYWSASITTVATGESVTIRPVIANPAGRILRYSRQSTADWYSGKSFQFLVYDTALPWGGITPSSASNTFGPIARTYDVGTYRVLVWSHPLTVSVRGRS
jgi:hypothetical protein